MPRPCFHACALLVCAPGLLLTGCVLPVSTTGHNQRLRMHLAQRVTRMYARYKAQAFPHVPEITARELLSLLPVVDKRSAPLLIDCRTPTEISVSRIPGAVSRHAFETRRERYRGRLLIPYCTIGYRSGLYARALRAQGFSVRNLAGGVLAWALAGQRFLTPAGEATPRVHVFGEKWNLLPPGYEGVY